MKKSRFLPASRRSIESTGSANVIPRSVSQTLIISAVLLRNKSVAASVSLNPEQEVEPNGRKAGQTPCGIYIAESSIPGSGIGLYAGVSYSKGNLIGSPDVAIQVVDRWFHHDDNVRAGQRPLDWILSDYFWQSNTCAPAHLETYGDTGNCVVPSLGMAANSHQGLYNAKFDVPRVGSAGLSRFRDPGAGAITNYRVEFETTADLKAGTELFMDYGANWFKERDDELGYTPLEDDFLWAGEALEKMVASNVLSSESDGNEERYKLLTNIISSIDKRKANALPKRAAELKRAKEEGAAAYSAPGYIREIKWLEENGTCIDMVQEKQSTIPGAGWGAFLKRSVKKGDVVIVSPLIHFPYDEVMNMYESSFKEKMNDSTAEFYDGEEEHSNRKKGEKIVGMQLLANYVFGHPESSMLFFPYAGSMGLINHGGEGKANVKLQWPSGKGPSLKYHQESWFDLTVEQMAATDKQKRGLMLEIVATRDIEIGEEVFLDYGSAWQDAWNEHIKKWEPWTTNGNYVPSSSLNIVGSLEKVRTESELSDNPYPGANIATACHFDFEDIDELEEFVSDDEDTRIFDWYKPTSENAEIVLEAEYILPCTIINRKIIKGEEYFTAIVFASPESDSSNEDNTPLFTDVILSKVRVEVRKIPRHAITFVDKPYSGDSHLPGTFRFPIMMPDDIFPKKWKNLAK